jgi:predicted deacetylase
MFLTKVVEKIKTQILCLNNFFSKSCRLWDNLEKFCTAEQAIDDNRRHAHCVLDTQGYRHTLRTCNTYRFSTATMVTLTRLNATFYVHSLSCLENTDVLQTRELIIRDVSLYVSWYVLRHWYCASSDPFYVPVIMLNCVKLSYLLIFFWCRV